MMGQHRRTESLFYYFRLEEQIPTDHLLRIIDGHVDFSFVRELLKDYYSPTGRPSIDPEVLLRLLLVGYLVGNVPVLGKPRQLHDPHVPGIRPNRSSNLEDVIFPKQIVVGENHNVLDTPAAIYLHRQSW